MRIINFLWNLEDIATTLGTADARPNYLESGTSSVPEFDSFFNNYCGLTNFKDSKFKQYESCLLYTSPSPRDS